LLVTRSVRADFHIAYTGAIEVRPAVAHNPITDQFMVAYAIQWTDGSGATWHDVACRLFNSDGSSAGSVLYPFGALGTFRGRGTPVSVFGSGRYVVGMTEYAPAGYDHMVIRHINADASYTGPAVSLFDSDPDKHPAAGAVNLVYNSLLGQFVALMHRTIDSVNYPYRKFVLTAQIMDANNLAHLSDPAFGSWHQLRRNCRLRTAGRHEPGRWPVSILRAGSTTLVDSSLNLITYVPIRWETPTPALRAAALLMER
jgi:hypothetical protein